MPNPNRMKHRKTKPKMVASSLSEDDFMGQITDLCKLLRLRWYHTHDSRRSTAGFPDLVIVGPDDLVFVELKRQDGRVTASQQEWLDDLTRIGQHAFVWRPADLDIAVKVLTNLARRRPVQ